MTPPLKQIGGDFSASILVSSLDRGCGGTEVTNSFRGFVNVTKSGE